VAEQRRSIVPTDHVDDRTMAAYIDGRLTGPAKAAVTAHIAECDDCHFVFAESARLRLEAEPESQSWRQRVWGAIVGAWHSFDAQPQWLRPVVITTGLAAAAGLTFVVQPQLARVWPGRSDVAELVAAVGTDRHFEARLTGGFEYGAVSAAPVVRGEASDDRLSPELRMAALKLEQRLKNERNASTLRAYAAAQLVMGHADKAVPPLEEAARMSPHDAHIESDLAAAYLVRFKDRHNLEDVTRAVAAASDAKDHDPKLREAQFNLALALEALSLREEARKAWQRYLEIDGSSPWSAEARRHLENLAPDKQSKRIDDEARQIAEAAARGDVTVALTVAKRLPDASYAYIENELLPGWADAWLARDRSKADDLLRRATVFSDALSAAIGESLPRDAVAAVGRAASAGAAAADAVARAHRTFREARRLYGLDKVTEAAARFAETRADFDRAGSPFSEWTVQYSAIAEYYHGRLTNSANLLDQVIDQADRRRHLILLGRALRMRGLVRQVSGDVGNSLDDYRRALVTLDAAGAREDVAATHSSIADNLQAIGDMQQAAAHEREALAAIEFLSDARRRMPILHRGSQIATQWAHLVAALAIRNEIIDEARVGGQPSAVIAAYHDRAEILQRLGRTDEAAADIAGAGRLLAGVTDPGMVARHEAELNLVRGELVAESNPAEALTPLKVSLAYFRDHGMDERLARVYLALGRAQRALANADEAEATFSTGIGVLEQQRFRLPNGGLRLSYFEQPWNLYDELIDLLSGPLKKPEAGLAIAERARGRELLDAASGTMGEPIEPTVLTRVLPSDTVVAYFVALPDRLLTWILQKGDVSTYVQPVVPGSLEAAIAEFSDALHRDSPNGADDAAKRLFDIVVGPWADRIPADATVVLVPDGALHELPFAALINPRTGHRLIQDHPIATAPSATMLIRAQRARIDAPLPRGARPLVIANPNIDAEDATGLPNLAGAEAEAHDIAKIYPNALVLTGSRATKRAFLDGAGTHEILHFAGHAVANNTYPILSRLLLARDRDGSSGNIFASELTAIDFRETKLVVLAACSTAAGPVRKGEGPVGLARPFLARGVPSVVATLWDVDDAASQTFFESFYSSLHDGATPAVALRQAQTTMLKNPDPRVRAPRAWAGFVNIGA